MIKRDKIAFLQILIVFGTRISSALYWMRTQNKKLVTQMPTTQEM